MQFSSNSKQQHKNIGGRDLTEVSKHIPAALMTYYKEVIGHAPSKKIVGQLGNTIISNVPGPAKEMDLLGAKLVTMSGITPIVDELGLFHAVVSYNGTLTINITACKKMMPDVKFYCQCINSSYQKLVASVEQRLLASRKEKQQVTPAA